MFTKITVDYDVSNNTKALLEDYENIIYISSESIKEFVHLVQNRAYNQPWFVYQLTHSLIPLSKSYSAL